MPRSGDYGKRETMLLVFGLRVVARVLAMRAGTCERCGRYASHQITESVRKLSVFFIPVCRVGAAKYQSTCTACGWVTDISRAEALSGTTSGSAPGPQDSPTWIPQDR